jgi:acyl carrier protein
MQNAMHIADRERIKARVRAIVQEQLEHDEVGYDKDNLENLEELGIDSLSFVEVIFQVEEAFGVKSGCGYTDEQLYGVRTLDEFADLIISAQAAG